MANFFVRQTAFYNNNILLNVLQADYKPAVHFIYTLTILFCNTVIRGALQVLFSLILRYTECYMA